MLSDKSTFFALGIVLLVGILALIVWSLSLFARWFSAWRPQGRSIIILPLSR